MRVVIYINIFSLCTVCKLQNMLRNAGLKQTPGDLFRAFKKTGYIRFERNEYIT
jgi:hypothetical protein